MSQRELDLEVLDTEQMPGDVPEEERCDRHRAEVETPDADARARNELQIALGDELVAYEAEDLDRSAREDGSSGGSGAPKGRQRGEIARLEMEWLVAVSQAEVLN